MTAKKVSETEDKKAVPFLRRLVSSRRAFFVIVVSAVGLVLLAFTGYAFAYTAKYLPNTTVAGVSIGGKSRPEAQKILADRRDGFLTSDLSYTYESGSWKAKPQDFGANFSTDAALEEVWSEQKAQPWYRQLQGLVQAFFIPTIQEVGFQPYSKEGEEALVKEVFSHVEQPYHEVDLDFSKPDVQIIPGKAGRKVNREEFEQRLYKAFKKGETAVALSTQPFQPELSEDQARDAQAQALAVLSGDWRIVLTPTKNITLTKAELKDLLRTEIVRSTQLGAQKLGIKLDTDQAQKKVTEWALSVKVEPSNAVLSWDGTTVVVSSEGKTGVQLVEDQTLAALTSAIQGYTTGGTKTITAVSQVSDPVVTASTLTALGLTQRVGSATTDYTGSPTNRRGNIEIGEKKISGTLVKPGETYSTITSLGPIDEAHGWLPELVIKGNRTLPEAGGGLCQVSTTLFRAVLNAGLPIVERQNHSYRVGYYERETGPGLDATVYDPKPDFRWKNDLEYPVYIQGSIKSNKITFDLFGTGDGRISSVSKPQIIEQTPVGDPIYVQTDTLFVGEQKQIETAHAGAKTVATYIVTKDGKEIINQTFRSTYRAWPAQYLVGTKPR